MKNIIEKIACTDCKLSDICLPFGLQINEIKALESIVKNKRPLHSNQLLYSLDEPCESLYVIKSGSFKSYITNPDGLEQTIGIYLPGELIGLSGLFKGQFDNSISALETSTVCEFPLTQLEDLCAKIPPLQHQLVRILSKEITDNHQQMILLGQASAKTKVATFLFILSKKYHYLGYSSTQFNLNLSREGIGNYLCMSPETVSRQLTILSKESIIEVKNNAINIINLDLLESFT